MQGDDPLAMLMELCSDTPTRRTNGAAGGGGSGGGGGGVNAALVRTISTTSVQSIRDTVALIKQGSARMEATALARQQSSPAVNGNQLAPRTSKHDGVKRKLSEYAMGGALRAIAMSKHKSARFKPPNGQIDPWAGQPRMLGQRRATKSRQSGRDAMGGQALPPMPEVSETKSQGDGSDSEYDEEVTAMPPNIQQEAGEEPVTRAVFDPTLDEGMDTMRDMVQSASQVKAQRRKSVDGKMITTLPLRLGQRSVEEVARGVRGGCTLAAVEH